MLELLLQTLCQSHDTSFGSSIVDKAAASDEAGYTCYRDYVSFLLLDHIWEECLNGVELTDDIYVEEFPEVVWGAFEHGVGVCNACVVAEDRGRTKGCSYFGCYPFHIAFRCEVAFEELYIVH